MLFDKVCHHLDRAPSGFDSRANPKVMARNARLFVIERNYELVDNIPNRKDKEWLLDHFCLPFRTIAINETWNNMVEGPCEHLIFLADGITDQNWDGREIGLRESRWGFHAIMEWPKIASILAHYCDDIDTSDFPDVPDDWLFVAFGDIWPTDNFDLSKDVWPGFVGNLNATMLLGPQGEWLKLPYEYLIENSGVPRFPDPEPSPHLWAQSCMQASSAMTDMVKLNTPSNFILERSRIDTRRRNEKARKLGRIPRRHERPEYTILRPDEIRRRMRLPAISQGGPKRPHERRCHPRTLRSPKFTHKQWETITVKESWIGPKENVVGRTKYKVITSYNHYTDPEGKRTKRTRKTWPKERDNG